MEQLSSFQSKDSEIEQLKSETECRMEKLHEENRVQQARDLATLQEIQNERIERVISSFFVITF